MNESATRERSVFFGGKDRKTATNYLPRNIRSRKSNINVLFFYILFVLSQIEHTHFTNKINKTRQKRFSENQNFAQI